GRGALRRRLRRAMAADPRQRRLAARGDAAHAAHRQPVPADRRLLPAGRRAGHAPATAARGAAARGARRGNPGDRPPVRLDSGIAEGRLPRRRIYEEVRALKAEPIPLATSETAEPTPEATSAMPLPMPPTTSPTPLAMPPTASPMPCTMPPPMA